MKPRSMLRIFVARLRGWRRNGEHECLMEAIRLFDAATEDLIRVARQHHALKD